MSQCSYRMTSESHCCPLWCIREEGHEGPHKNYSGRWNAETEFRCAPAACPATVPRTDSAMNKGEP